MMNDFRASVACVGFVFDVDDVFAVIIVCV